MNEKMKETPITLRYEDGRVYTLEFSRDTVKLTEESGFERNKVSNHEMTQVPLLFFGAFKMHHPEVTKEETDKILFEDLGGLSDALSSKLIALYNEPYESLFNEEGKVKNPNLTVLL